MRSAQPPPPVRIHRAARTEDVVRSLLNRWLVRRGWSPQVLPFAGYGLAGGSDGGGHSGGDSGTDDGWVRLLGRVLLTPPGSRRDPAAVRGWRRFLSAPAPGIPVTVQVAGQEHQVMSGRDGYLDLVLPAALPAGRGQALVSAAGSPPASAPLYVVGTGKGTGIVSDIDDTVMITALPRPMVAFWNTFVRQETSRVCVPGMPVLYHALLDAHPDAFVVYLSTGPWNVAPALEQFLARHGYPPGPLLLTDWGPTASGWFRSGREHKQTQLRRLLGELPGLTWLLVGDDGQHDPDIYTRVAEEFPGRVRAVLIRQLTAIEQVLTHGTPEPLEQSEDGDGPPSAAVETAVDEIRAPDGGRLLAELARRGLLPAAQTWP
jgi:phosphatidate phosphatase APP1